MENVLASAAICVLILCMNSSPDNLRKLFCILTSILLFAVANVFGETIELTKNWSLISANGIADGGEKISTAQFDSSKWYPVTIPSTIMAGLVANGVYSNLYFGQNMKSVPDLSKQQWWFRGEFVAPENSGGQFWLRFKGIAYKAEIWLNGKLLDTN